MEGGGRGRRTQSQKNPLAEAHSSFADSSRTSREVQEVPIRDIKGSFGAKFT
jgi:hypothetical protein